MENILFTQKVSNTGLQNKNKYLIFKSNYNYKYIKKFWQCDVQHLFTFTD